MSVTTILTKGENDEWEWNSLLSEFAMGKIGEKILREPAE